MGLIRQTKIVRDFFLVYYYDYFHYVHENNKSSWGRGVVIGLESERPSFPLPINNKERERGRDRERERAKEREVKVGW